jgi:hypothetical protein
VAYVVLNSFRIDLRRNGVNPEGDEKRVYEVMAGSRGLGDLGTRLREKNTPVRLDRNIAIPLESLKGLRDGDVTDAEPIRQINGTRFPDRPDLFVNHFQIVLGFLAPVIRANSIKAIVHG